MAVDKKTVQKLEALDLEGELLNCVSYATYYNRIPLFTSFRLINNGAEDIEELTVTVTGSDKLVLSSQISVKKVPAESGTEVKTPPLLNPKFLAEIKDKKDCTVTVCVSCGKITVCTISATVTALPMDSWSGLSGNAEMLSAFVRPRLSDCKKILAEAGLQLKTWGYSREWSGYTGNDKNAVNFAFASIFSAVRNLGLEREDGGVMTDTVSVGNLTEILFDRKATPLAMAVFTASCLEAAKLNPVIVVGANKIAVGVWLVESCFNAPVMDDLTYIERYISSGVNSLAIVDVDDLFAHKNASYATSAAHFSSLLQAGRYDLCIDVKRCRIGGVFSMPIKIESGSSYEILEGDRYSYDAKPEKLINANDVTLERKSTRNGNWERRLLDLSQKNNLLNFRYERDCVHLLISDTDGFAEKLTAKESFNLLPNVAKLEEGQNFGLNRSVGNLSELINLELNSGIVRACFSESVLKEAVRALIRKGKSSEEETGANTLYLALGFLRWKHAEDKEYKYAPIALLPVRIKNNKTQGTEIVPSEEFSVNTTLLEFLKQEFGLDLRGLQDNKFAPSKMLAVVRSKTAHMKDWLVFEDAYLAQFTFAGYAIWRDVRDNMDEYKKNPLICGLLENKGRLADNTLIGADEDTDDPAEILTPLACDSSQYAAVAEAAAGKTFVLHGPPGTGKSQTITNIIANALDRGKRVLFVAEKQAALNVVKKRLGEIGIGEFCLELHSGKTADKGEIVRSIENALELKSTFDESKFIADAEAIKTLRETIKNPMSAMHEKRGTGVSVYEGILSYFKNFSAPELVNVESVFYDNLTAQKLAEYEGMLLSAQAAARECGGVCRSPFSNVNATYCDDKFKRSVLCSAEVTCAEIKHLKNYLSLFLETFGQKTGTFTVKKLNTLVEIIKLLAKGTLDVFYACDERELRNFYNANLRYDAAVKNWLTRFKGLAELGKLFDELDEEIENFNGDFSSSHALTVAIKKISRLAKTPIKDEEKLGVIKEAAAIEKERRKIADNTALSDNFLGLTGGINDKKREEFLKPFYAFHALCTSVFMDYNADAFNAVCVKAKDKRFKPLFDGFISAASAFYDASGSFNEITECDIKAVSDEDIFDYYGNKCSYLIENIDMLPAWCTYKATAKKLNESGLTFITDALESGRISGEKILSAFRKNVFGNFVKNHVPADLRLADFSATVIDEAASNLTKLYDEFIRLTRLKIRKDLISRLPAEGTEGALALELLSFKRQTGSNLRGLNLRNLFASVPELLKVAAPCMLMSPFTVSQYLPAQSDLFDLAIFDEASQLPTCEAVPSLARAKSAVIVGDPKQMPPTSFFMSVGADEDNPEADDLESVLDDCLALGIPEKHLIWHYRSKHESLIAFSNITYYSSRLCTFPSPDAADSKVRLKYVEGGVYERGASKCNKKEAEDLCDEVIRRLSDPILRKSSLGVVTFSTPQQAYIEKLLYKKIAEKGLDEFAYGGEEPLFVKNLENVQGDERDVILFSVCYGPDRAGKISLNFGPLNQVGGWRRLNVAVSRAREEMLVFSSMRYTQTDLSRTTSKGVAGLKAFLEFAEKGRLGLASQSDETALDRAGIGKYIAKELSLYGYECRCDVGASDFKIDVAVLDPSNRKNFILAVLCDGDAGFSVKDKFVMQVNALKRGNWNVVRLYSVNFFNNPKREIKKIKDLLDRLTSSGGNAEASYKKVYKAADTQVSRVSADALSGGDMDEEIVKTLKSVVSAEEPISRAFLIKRVLAEYGITKYGARLENKVGSLISSCAFKSADMLGQTHYYKSGRAVDFRKFRVEEGSTLRTSKSDYSPFDMLALIRALLIRNVGMYRDELVSAAVAELKIKKLPTKFEAFLSDCIDEGVTSGMFIRSASDKISLS